MSTHKLNFINYKSFENGEIELNPLTILLGMNNSGKSSIIKLILLINQTIESGKFRQVGEKVDLGGAANLFRDLNTKNDIKINLSISQNNIIQSECSRFSGNVIDDLYSKLFHFDIYSFFLKIDKADIKYKLEAGDIKGALNLLMKLRKESEAFADSHSYEDETKSAIRLIFESSIKKIKFSHLAFEGVSSVNSIEYTIAFNTISGLNIKEIKIESDNDNYWSIRRDKTGKWKLMSSNNKLNRIKKIINISDAISVNGLIPKAKEKIKSANIAANLKAHNIEYAELIFRVIYTAALNATSIFKDVYHIPPLRSHPERYFANAEQNSEKIRTDTKSVAAYLAERPELKEKANKWLEKFNIAVNTKKVDDYFNSIQLESNGLSLNLADVGFGYSQVIPVLTTSILAPRKSLIIIEQPEVHIHPKMQGELADFFIELAKEDGKIFIIETHSEALLKRLRRRIAEFGATNECTSSSKESSTKSSAISKDKVAIYITEKNNQLRTSTIKKSTISSTGNFDWPNDFIENDIEDIVEFMKLQG
ncbi:AAA family ATPase [Chitinibacter bivalviorum]|uniref:AAA family ATPase n=1 Tax=Chitinibacter bivalviorum TaxID=2739434 RepID=A0A7H9BKJ4_9NEIS|nr:AAA family ATPase [Chitinibacter bivalviorum]QLG89009.1 AAA family ATPase [Chitinibacter bivalviorum]